MSTPSPNVIPSVPDRDWLLTLATALQTTLELEPLVRLFAEHVAQLVAHDGIRYATDRDDTVISAGAEAEHSCSYALVLESTSLGNITFMRHQPFSVDETTVLEDVLANLVHPLRNALLYHEALEAAARDPLTGVNNRASLQTILDREIELARRHESSLCVIMVDCDRFKRINDEHGHLAGDNALKALANCILACARDSDIVFRYGGEEFTIVLSNTALDGATLLADRVRAAVEQTAIRTHGAEIHMTVSMGVATADSQDDTRSLLDRADAALYLSKAHGRNRVSTERDL